MGQVETLIYQLKCQIVGQAGREVKLGQRPQIGSLHHERLRLTQAEIRRTRPRRLLHRRNRARRVRCLTIPPND